VNEIAPGLVYDVRPEPAHLRRSVAEHAQAVDEYNQQMTAWQETEPMVAGEGGIPRRQRWEPRDVPTVPDTANRFAGMSDDQIREELRPKVLVEMRPSPWNPSVMVTTLLKPGMP